MLPLLLTLFLATPAQAQQPQVTPFQVQLYTGGSLLGAGRDGCPHIKRAAAMAKAGKGPSGSAKGWDQNMLEELSRRCGIR